MNARMLSIDLPPDLVQLVRSHVDSGAYASDSAVIRDALDLLQQRDRNRSDHLASLRAGIAAAAADPNRLTNAELGRHFDKRLTEAKRAS